MRPKSDGKPGRAKITLTGFGSPRPGVVIDYRERNGRKDHARLDIPKVALERPQAFAARVRDGQNGIERLDLRLKVNSETDQRKELVRTSKSERTASSIDVEGDPLIAISNEDRRAWHDTLLALDGMFATVKAVLSTAEESKDRLGEIQALLQDRFPAGRISGSAGGEHR